MLTFAGIQDASRKRRETSQTPGAWAGLVLYTNNMEVYVTVSQDRWEKTQAVLNWMLDALSQDVDHIPYKTLESHRGFLVYVTCSYPATVPYLKGIHMTLDGWRENRDDEGWVVQVQVQQKFSIQACHPQTFVDSS